MLRVPALAKWYLGVDGQLLKFAVKYYVPFVIVMGLIVYFGQSVVG